MSQKNPAVDGYIENAAEFAQPILKRLRKLIHRACPQVVETIKWGIPYFEYHGLLVGMAAFKQHVSFGFWRSKQMSDPAKLFDRGPKASMCNVRAAKVGDLPADDVILQYLAEAIQLNEDAAEGTRQPRTNSRAKSGTRSAVSKLTPQATKTGRGRVVVPAIPVDLREQLASHSPAKKFFTDLSPGAQRDYIVWIESAKRPATRASRLATTIAQLSEQKTLNWKYERK